MLADGGVKRFVQSIERSEGLGRSRSLRSRKNKAAPGWHRGRFTDEPFAAVAAVVGDLCNQRGPGIAPRPNRRGYRASRSESNIPTVRTSGRLRSPSPFRSRHVTRSTPRHRRLHRETGTPELERRVLEGYVSRPSWRLMRPTSPSTYDGTVTMIWLGRSARLRPDLCAEVPFGVRQALPLMPQRRMDGLHPHRLRRPEHLRSLFKSDTPELKAVVDDGAARPLLPQPSIVVWRGRQGWNTWWICSSRPFGTLPGSDRFHPSPGFRMISLFKSRFLRQLFEHRSFG